MKTVLTVTFTVLGIAIGVFLLAKTLLALGTVVASALVAVAIDHGVQFLQSHGWRRAWAILAVLTLLALLAVGAGWLVIPEAVNQVSQLVERLPTFIEQLRESSLYATLQDRFGVDNVLGGEVQLPEETLATSVTALRHVVTWVVVVATLLFTVIFMLAFGGKLVKGLLAEATPGNRERYERFLDEVYRSVGGYLAGLAILAAINAVVNSLALALFGLPYFLPLGIVSGFGSFIPFVGAITAGALMGVVGLASGGLWIGLGVVAWYVVYQQIENNVFGPLIYRRTIQINPLVALLAVVFAAELLGIVGAILAVPAAAVAQIVVQEVVRLRRERMQLPPDVPVAESLGDAETQAEARGDREDGAPDREGR
ncbi:AI-2E family transporter [Vulgatibacter sp.]|uniref:AI-2E family transporter n=1 Tax=Vulgatibacter sp. TaxID=1971226 RepID=UPI0035614706